MYLSMMALYAITTGDSLKVAWGRVFNTKLGRIGILKVNGSYGMNDRISAAARMSTLQAEVTCKKWFILLPQKRIKLSQV
jgi:hypothetical protein